MKRWIAFLLMLTMMIGLLSGCGGKSGGSDTKAPEAEASGAEDNGSEPLRVAVQSFYCSAMVEYIQENKLDEAAGLNIEWVVFNGGAPINEAMGEWDIAVTGGAFVYALANYDCRLVAHQVNGTGGNNICA